MAGHSACLLRVDERQQVGVDDVGVGGEHPVRVDALQEGFEVYPVVDAVGGTSREAHEAGLQRLVQAGAKPTSWVQLICELQRDWNRSDTVPGFSEILFAVEGH